MFYRENNCKTIGTTTCTLNIGIKCGHAYKKYTTYTLFQRVYIRTIVNVLIDAYD